jgi:hypothetical protein
MAAVGKSSSKTTAQVDQAGYSFADVLVLTAATRSNLIHWTNIGIIKPDLADTKGPGHPRRFSTFNLIEIQVAAAINRFRVPAEVIRGAANVFRAFHLGAVALYEETHSVPFGESAGKVITVGVDGSEMPGRVGRFATSRQRETHARMFQTSDPNASGVADIWYAVRTSRVIAGQPITKHPDETFSKLRHFIGLFITEDAAAVAIDPPTLSVYVDGSAIVIDLVDAVWRVGERFRRLTCNPEPW